MLKAMEEMRLEAEAERLMERRVDQDQMQAVARNIKDGVRTEMDAAMKPWQERTLRVEESTAEMREEVKKLTEEMKELKEQLATRPEERSYAGMTRRGDSSGASVLTSANKLSTGGSCMLEDQLEKERIRGLLSDASRILGLKPIEKKHVEHTKRRLTEVEGETDEEKENRAKEGTLMMFLKWELKMGTPNKAAK